MTLNTELNVIEVVQEIVDKMQTIEKEFFEAEKAMNTLNERQNDLLHTIELDLSTEEAEAVMVALKELRKERREIKDQQILLAEAKDFVGANYKFMNEGLQLVKKLKYKDERVSTRKYYVRNCEALEGVIDIKKYPERLGVNVNLEESRELPTELTSMVDKFNAKWNKQK